MRTAKPFLKWAGGKSQLIDTISIKLPKELREQEFTYIEPFIGSGALMFWMIQEYRDNITKVVINDINSDLTNVYSVIKEEPDSLISYLELYEKQYHNLVPDSEERKLYFYDKRTLYNSRSLSRVEQASLFIFLNRTCFNGLYRVNRKNEFNVPIGSYKTPKICDSENLLLVSDILQKVKILTGDYQKTIEYASNNSFFYFDPPYKPLSETSSFNSYAKDDFGDLEQGKLKLFCDSINNKGYLWLLSNSDVKAVDPSNLFFDNLYQNYLIERVEARRLINSKAKSRGTLNELLIRNYK